MRRAGAALAVAGIAVLALGLLWVRPVSLRPGDIVVVNADRPGLSAHNSPEVARHPSRPGVVAVADRIDLPRFGCSVSLSTTGGASWRSVPLPLPAEAPNCFAPDVGFDGDGELLVLYTATGGRFNQPLGVWLQRYRGEAPSGPAVPVAGPVAFHARMAVRDRRVAVAWVQAAPGAGERPLGWEAAPNPVVLSRSDDGGRTFATPVTVSELDRRVVQPSVLLGPGDEVVVGALDLGDDVDDYEARHLGQGGPPSEARWRIVTWRSADATRFGPATVVAGDLVPPSRIIVNLAPAPGFTRDPGTGRLYATWDAGRGDGRDVFVARSDDGGGTWSPAVAVAPGPGGQYLPAVDVAPGGRVDVLFYDRRRDPEDVMAEAVLATSGDGGRTFATTTVSDRAFDSRIGFGGFQGIPLLGSRVAVLSSADQALAFWSDTSAGTETTGNQDLAVAPVGISDAAQRPRWALVAAGVAVALAGLGLASRGIHQVRERSGVGATSR